MEITTSLRQYVREAHKESCKISGKPVGVARVDSEAINTELVVDVGSLPISHLMPGESDKALSAVKAADVAVDNWIADFLERCYTQEQRATIRVKVLKAPIQRALKILDPLAEPPRNFFRGTRRPDNGEDGESENAKRALDLSPSNNDSANGCS